MTATALNPNHPVTQLLNDGFMHKIAAIELARAAGGLPQ